VLLLSTCRYIESRQMPLEFWYKEHSKGWHATREWRDFWSISLREKIGSAVVRFSRFSGMGA